ncbi:AraC family transcriptional regulator [Paenibacillus sp. YN15]|uniref:helix-turn-helix domain-containing protein n=1 Tax=Paenibacillus sp. YN15 TaxID=1742774 RepID=UPI000DCBAED6|nr:AraC family transcriptional regulator [Paenibacillus sp. YN15]RAV04659.1 AraC family transcriptional regulator [Paenibacillus sp. YN15]
MPMPACTVMSCGYSIHTKTYSSRRLLPYYLLRFQAEGTSRIHLNGIEQEYVPGDLMIAAPGDNYVLETGQPDGQKSVRCADYYLSCTIEKPLDWLEGDFRRKLHLGLDEPFLNLFKNLVYERRRLPDQDTEMQDYLARLLLLSIRRSLSPQSPPHPVSRAAARMKSYMEAHSCQPLTLKQIASYGGLGISRASELFKEAYGCSVMDYAILMRLNNAREHILYDTVTLEEAAFSCGFTSYTHFSRMFRKRYGVSPSEYRQQNRQTQ